MHLVTFSFICIEIVIMLYLVVYKLARSDDRTTVLNIGLILFLIVYNFTGGLLPDPRLPGSFFVQEVIAYATGFITPCYFPYYVYKGFDLKKMRFHAYYGVFMFLMMPYLAFCIIFYFTDDLNSAKNVLIVPVIYALWVLCSLVTAIRSKYNKKFETSESKEELIILLLCLAPWVGLPFIAYFDADQATEALTTNAGFLLLLALHLKRNITQLRIEHERLIRSEIQLKTWNEHLMQEVEKRTMEIERLNKEEKFRINCTYFNLTKREQEIAFLVFTGNTYRLVAETLSISERTVAKHIQNIFEKISVSNRSELCHKLGV